MAEKVAFLDRDGTLIVEPPEDLQVDSLEKLSLIPDVIPALLKLRDAGYTFVMVTNQDGLGTDAFPQQDFEIPQNKMLEMFASQGIVFTDILIDDSFEHAPKPTRKPGLGLVLPWLKNGRMDFDRSFVVGDRDTDLTLAANMGIRGFKLGADLGWRDIAHEVLNLPRTATVNRNTTETQILVQVDLDQSGNASIETGIGFFDHMLTQVALHGDFALTLQCSGDLHIDDHHTIEDCALALGQALNLALGDKRGIGRYGFVLPMDEVLTQAAVDLSGRPVCRMELPLTQPMIGSLATEMIPHFFASLAQSLGAAIHIQANGDNNHHIAEGAFKALGRCFRQAFSRTTSNEIPSSKGTLM